MFRLVGKFQPILNFSLVQVLEKLSTNKKNLNKKIKTRRTKRYVLNKPFFFTSVRYLLRANNHEKNARSSRIYYERYKEISHLNLLAVVLHALFDASQAGLIIHQAIN